ncbi:hypothetical protein CsSME_00040304 [Camellia sinensis var. sinensis]
MSPPSQKPERNEPRVTQSFILVQEDLEPSINIIISDQVNHEADKENPIQLRKQCCVYWNDLTGLTGNGVIETAWLEEAKGSVAKADE